MAANRARRKAETELALRRAAIDLMAERGYDATSTDDIARAAGVSPRTFFNYFPTKESVVALPDGLLVALVTDAVRRRPLGEDVAASLAAAALAAVDALGALGRPEADTGTLLRGLRLLFTERPLRQVFFERRASAEDAVWQVLLERGVAAEDLGARAAVGTVVSLTYLALWLWVEGGAAEPLAAVVARVLLQAPDPARFAAGVTAFRSG